MSEMDQIDGVGAVHGSDLLSTYRGGILGDYLIRFAATLDPNGDGAPQWPRYAKESPRLLRFAPDGSVGVGLDTFRAEEIAYLRKLSLADPL